MDNLRTLDHTVMYHKASPRGKEWEDWYYQQQGERILISPVAKE